LVLCGAETAFCGLNRAFWGKGEKMDAIEILEMLLRGDIWMILPAYEGPLLR